MPHPTPPPSGPSATALVPVAVLVVVVAATAGSIWGANSFLGTCAAASILAGLLVTRGK